MNNEENGVSIAEIFKVIFHRVWWVVGVTVAALIAGILIVQFWYNRTVQTYTISYTIDFPGILDNVYPDGTIYRYSSVISPDVLNEIVEGDEQFSGIDVQDMVEDDGIQISTTTVYSDESDTTTATNYYSLTVSAKYFSSSTQAAAFMRAVAGYPVTKVNTIIAQTVNNTYLTIYGTATSFEAKIDALANQRDYLIEKYDELIENMSGEYVIEGKTLTEYRTEVADIFDENAQEEVTSILLANNYVLAYEQYADTAEAKIDYLKKQIQTNDAIIQALQEAMKSGIYDLEPYNALIAEYTIANAELKNQITEIENTLSWIEGESRDEDIESFTAVLDDYCDMLNTAVQTYKTVSQIYYEEMCDVTYMANSITAEGGLNLALAAIVGAVIGFIAVCIIICIIDMPKYLKEREKSRASATQSDEKEE